MEDFSGAGGPVAVLGEVARHDGFFGEEFAHLLDVGVEAGFVGESGRSRWRYGRGCRRGRDSGLR